MKVLDDWSISFGGYLIVGLSETEKRVVRMVKKDI
jgi:hypothetical protein